MTPDQIAELAKQGLLGVLLLCSIGAIIYLYKALAAVQTQRMADWKEISDVVKSNSNSLRDWIAANESRTRALEQTGRAQELSAASHTALAHEVSLLRDTIGEAIQSNRAVREALLKQGVNL